MRRGRGVLPRPRGRAEGRSWPVAATHSLRQRTCSSSHHSSATNDLRMMMVSLEFKIFEWFHLICMARATTRGGERGKGRQNNCGCCRPPPPRRWGHKSEARQCIMQIHITCTFYKIKDVLGV